MIAALRVLYPLVRGGGPDETRRLGWSAGLWVAAEWAILTAVFRGLDHLRAGTSTGPALTLFLAALAVYAYAITTTKRRAQYRFNTVARESVHELVTRLHRLPLVDFEAIGRGVLVTRLLVDGNRLAKAGESVAYAITGAGRLAVALLFVSMLSAEALAVVLAVGLLVLVISVGQLALMSEGYGRTAADEATLYDLLRDQLGGAIALRLHGPRARAVTGVWRRVSDRLRDWRMRMWAGFFERQSAYNALVYALIGVNVFILPLFVPIDAEAIREVNLAILWLLFSIVQLVFTAPQLDQAAQAAERLAALRAELGEERLEPHPPPIDRGRFDGFATLELEGLTFSYPGVGAGSGFTVGPIDLRLGRGELVFVTGHNGSGKSTFLKMLTGLYHPSAGTVRVDGEPIAPADLADYRALFGTIFTAHTLFERVYGFAPGDEARAAGLLEEMGIADKTAIVDGRITRRDLSTGQKKRLAMALVRLQDRPILLLDEWAADQDPGFRDVYYHTLLPALRGAGKLVLVVTHDDQHFHLADRTIHFTDGLLVDSGAADR